MDELTILFQQLGLIMRNHHKGVRGKLKEYDLPHINRIYGAAKLLSDLCWQEIERRRDA